MERRARSEGTGSKRCLWVECKGWSFTFFVFLLSSISYWFSFPLFPIQVHVFLLSPCFHIMPPITNSSFPVSYFLHFPLFFSISYFIIFLLKFWFLKSNDEYCLLYFSLLPLSCISFFMFPSLLRPFMRLPLFPFLIFSYSIHLQSFMATHLHTFPFHLFPFFSHHLFFYMLRQLAKTVMFSFSSVFCSFYSFPFLTPLCNIFFLILFRRLSSLILPFPVSSLLLTLFFLLLLYLIFFSFSFPLSLRFLFYSFPAFHLWTFLFLLIFGFSYCFFI